MAMTSRIARLQELLREAGLAAFLTFSPENRRYLSGFTGSAGYVLVPAASNETPILWTDFRYTEQAAAEAPGFSVRRHAGGVFEEIAGAVQAWNLGRRIGIESQRVVLADFEKMHGVRDIEWVPQAGLVERIRMVKTPDEVGRIRHAAAVAGRACEAVLAGFTPGLSELDVAIRLEESMRRGGGERLAFDTIVVSGPRGSLPHGQPGERRIQSGELLTLDFGTVFTGYNSDETVTVGIGHDVPQRLRDLYEVVWEAQQAGLAAVRSGVSASSIDKAARDVIAAAGFGPNFGHSTGHGVGLEVHELPWVASHPPTDFVLEPGMVITVEPGIYVPDQGGVRLEDTVLVTESGMERLTTVDKSWRTV